VGSHSRRLSQSARNHRGAGQLLANNEYAERLVSKWEAGESGHATAIRGFKEAVEKCKNMR
jgi:hypothetical protein